MGLGTEATAVKLDEVTEQGDVLDQGSIAEKVVPDALVTAPPHPPPQGGIVEQQLQPLREGDKVARVW
ncbi:MAG TPA: hypothetical protein VHR39_02180 [Propionibacteriaceae bacterium]|nr:hypothetical protein [Propionibacteriaceae bacterium]